MKCYDWNYKEGVITAGLSPYFYMSHFDSCGILVSAVSGTRATVTAALDGKHSVNSMHYKGMAIDIRTKDWKCDVETLARAIAFHLGNDYCVVMEPDHLHVQISTANIKGTIERIDCGNFIKSSRCN